MKQDIRRYVALTVLAFGLANDAMAAADYSSYTNEEMMQMQSQARDMSSQDRDAFRSEMQSRQRSMTTVERNQLREQNRSNGQGHRYGQGNGGEQGNRSGQGSGGGQGQGGGGRGR